MLRKAPCRSNDNLSKPCCRKFVIYVYKYVTNNCSNIINRNTSAMQFFAD